MNTRDLQTLYEYYFWANRKILDTAARVSPEQFVAVTPLANGSLRNTLTHLLDDSTGWRNLCQRGTKDFFGALNYESVPTLDSLLPLWNREEQAMRDYLASLTDDALAAPVSFSGPADKKPKRPLWQALYHITNHATEHRSGAAAILSAYGYSLGELDLPEFWNEQA